MAGGGLELGQALSTAVCAHICSSVSLGEHCRFGTVAESAIQGLSDVLAAYIVEVGSSAQRQAELAGRAESNLVDVMQTLQARSERELAPWGELLQLVQTPVPRLPANLLSGGPLCAVDVRVPSTEPSSIPERANLPSPLKSGGREYREAVGFLPALPARHTFVGADLPTMSVDPESHAKEQSAQRRRTAARRQVEMNLCKLRSEVVAQDRSTQSGTTHEVDSDEKATGMKTVVGLGTGLRLSAMNERAGRYTEDGAASALWTQNGLSPQTFLNNQALLAAARSARASKRKRKEVVAPQQQPLQGEVQIQHPAKAESTIAAAPSQKALVLASSSGSSSSSAPAAPAMAAVAPVNAAEESDDDDKPLATRKRPALTIGNKPRPSLTISRAGAPAPARAPAPAVPNADVSIAPDASGTPALPTSSPARSPEQSPVAGMSSSADIPMSHPKLMSQCLKMLAGMKEYQFSWPFLDPVPENTPGYSLYVKEPIDISTIEDRLKARQYDSLAAFEAAFKLMYDNCDAYNDPTINQTGAQFLECSKKSRAKAEKRFEKIRKKLLDVSRARSRT